MPQSTGEEIWWVAQCLEFDIAVQARNLGDAKYEFIQTFVAHIVSALELGQKPFEGVPKAPSSFWALYAGSTDSLDPATFPAFKLPEGVPEPWMIPDDRFLQARVAAPLRGPRGAVTVRRLTRGDTLHFGVTIIPPGLNDGDRLTPMVLASMCRRLAIPLSDFGLDSE